MLTTNRWETFKGAQGLSAEGSRIAAKMTLQNCAKYIPAVDYNAVIAVASGDSSQRIHARLHWSGSFARASRAFCDRMNS